MAEANSPVIQLITERRVGHRPAVIDDGQLLPRQIPTASVTVTATTWLTKVVQETRQVPDTGAANTLQRAPLTTAPSEAGSQNVSPAAVATAETPTPSQPGMLAPKHPASNGMLSQSTQKLLIAAGSIGATIVVAFLVYMMYRWRKRKEETLKFTLPQRRSSTRLPDRPEPAPQQPAEPTQWNDAPQQYPWEKSTWETNSSSRSLLFPPRVLARPETSSSFSRPFPSAQRPSQSPFPPPNPFPNPSSLSLVDRSVLYIDPLEDSPLGRRESRRASIAASSPLLPIEGTSQIMETEQKRRSSSPNVAPYIRQSRLGMTPGPPPIAGPAAPPPKASRFSWTNSQAPKTPLRLILDKPSPEKTMNATRFSVTSTRSSMPRYRTVESWVGHQMDRLDERSIQESLRSEDEDKFMDTMLAPTSRHVSRSRFTNGTRNSDSPVFRQHPGTEVQLPRASLIPSEILDDKLGPRDL